MSEDRILPEQTRLVIRPSAAMAADIRRWQAPSVQVPACAAAGRGARTGTGSRMSTEELARLERQAHEEAYRRGFDQGRAAGERAMREQADRLAELIGAIGPQAVMLDDQLHEQLGVLLMAVARQFVRRELGREPGEIVRVLREALGLLPVMEASVRLYLHPEDAALLRETVAPEKLDRPVSIVEDMTMTRGGVRVETDTSIVDASVETRLNALAAKLFGNERASDRSAGEDGSGD